MTRHVEKASAEKVALLLDAIHKLNYRVEVAAKNAVFYYNNNGHNHDNSYLISKRGDTFTIETVTDRQISRFVEIMKRVNRFADKLFC